jgi:hypothetical protein
MNQSSYENMSIDEISNLQQHLDMIKAKKLQIINNRPGNHGNPNNMGQQPKAYCINKSDIVQNPSTLSYDQVERMNEFRSSATPIYGSDNRLSGAQGLSRLKKTENNYYNPYEHSGHNQQEFGTLARDMHLGPYGVKAPTMKMMGLNDRHFADRFPNNTKNVSIETPLTFGETSRFPKQSGLSMIEQDRFNPLYWDPQDTRHIIRPDGYPQAGINTRLDRIEYA